MSYTQDDITGIREMADNLKNGTGRVLSSTSKNELATHRDALQEAALTLEQVINYRSEVIEMKRRELADERTEQRNDDLLRKELKEHARRCNNGYWELKNQEP